MRFYSAAALNQQDKILLKGLSFYGYHGAKPEVRVPCHGMNSPRHLLLLLTCCRVRHSWQTSSNVLYVYTLVHVYPVTDHLKPFNGPGAGECIGTEVHC